MLQSTCTPRFLYVKDASCEYYTLLIIQVWNVADIISSSSPSSPLPPLVTLHPTGTLGSTLIWLRPGQLASYSTYYHHYPHILHRRILTQALAQAPVQSESQIWDITKHLQESKKRLAYQKSDMYNPQSIKLPAPPTTIVYANGVLVMGDEEGKVRVVSPLTGECLSEFKNHKGAVTDLHVVRGGVDQSAILLLLLLLSGSV